ncbi:Calycin-like [Melia azedarach]|uniref:Calycin-like n=1 Tax=Melia azedarach TaxID=155640 RepID=A0ACC1YU89_MELAZ|nr:Calycin-like [Melia azedarach]
MANMQYSGCFHWNSTAKLGFHHTLNLSSSSTIPYLNSKSSKVDSRKLLITQSYKNHQQQQRRKNKDRVEVRGKKENVWSIDNEMAKAKETELAKKSQQRRRRGRRGARGRRNKSGQVMVSAAMLVEVETVLQTQEPVIKPAWNTFTSSVSGIWKGVGAVFSPITAEMEPIEIGSKHENLYDCYTLARVEAVPSISGGQGSQIQRKINWVTLNPYGEILQHLGGSSKSKEEVKDRNAFSPPKETVDASVSNHVLPNFHSFNFESSDVMEEDVMDNEPGLVFFEDGSYSRGPVDMPVGEVDDSKYYLSPTFKFEQCLVKGCHKRLRIVHTIEFGNGGSDIQIMRVAVYEEQWVSPANIRDESDLEFDLKPFSQQKRTHPSELTGSWKVFEKP